MKDITCHVGMSPFEGYVEGRGQDKGQNCGSQAPNKSKTELKAWYSHCHSPGDQNQDSPQCKDHGPTQNLKLQLLWREQCQGAITMGVRCSTTYLTVINLIDGAQIEHLGN